MDSSPPGYWTGAVGTSKLGGDGRLTLIGGSACPCASAAVGASRSRASDTNSEVPNPIRTMSLLLSPKAAGPTESRRAARLPPAPVGRPEALNITALPGHQAGTSLLVLLLVLIGSG